MGNAFTFAEYHQAAVVLWGPAGGFLVDEYQRHNAAYFDAALPPLPIVIGLTAYGHCLGLTRLRGPWRETLPRITIASNLFREGTQRVSDVVLHEMVHVKLILAGESHQHNGRPWCAELERLSPLVLGHAVRARPVHPRWIQGQVRRQARPGELPRKALSMWPYALRPPETDPGAALAVPSY